LQLYYQIAVQARSEIGLAPDEYAGFTMALLRMLAFAPGAAAPRSRASSAFGSKRETSAPFAGTQPAPAAPAAAAPQPAVLASAAPVGSEAWAEIVEQLGLTGMARMLAQHCELTRRDGERIDLMLPRTHERLFEKGYVERVKSALQKRFGEALRVSITIGDGSGTSPVAVAQRERDRQQARAIADIEQDPFVRELVENFDARVNESSIKPLQ
jgi:DNA polymerase-3 subunit gamma/tau